MEQRQPWLDFFAKPLVLRFKEWNLALAVKHQARAERRLDLRLDLLRNQCLHFFPEKAGSVVERIAHAEELLNQAHLALNDNWGVAHHGELPAYKVPLAGRFYGNASGQASQGTAFYATSEAPRVTPADIDAEIASERYFTAADGVLGAYRAGGDVHSFGGTPSQATHQALGLLTFCVLVLKNGTKIVGINYGAIDPSQHSAKRGREEARAHAIEQIWPLLGFRLRDKLAGT